MCINRQKYCATYVVASRRRQARSTQMLKRLDAKMLHVENVNCATKLCELTEICVFLRWGVICGTSNGDDNKLIQLNVHFYRYSKLQKRYRSLNTY